MKGVVLAGGTGSRLMPLTIVTNKHLLPIYDQPMIMFPLQTLIGAGITEIMIVSGRGHAGHFLELLGSGEEIGVNLSYAVQEKADGIAGALKLAKRFVNGDNVAVILGDNIFEDKFDLSEFKGGAKVHLKKVSEADAERFGVANLDEDRRIIEIIEKPKKFISPYAVTGLYVYDYNVFDIIKKLKPSNRGELEITDVNNTYIKERKMDYEIVKGFWSDAGQFESLYRASTFAREKEIKRQFNSMNFKEGKINGVATIYPIKNEDKRGWLIEIFRRDIIDKDIFPEMSYISLTNPGITRGPHEHIEQTDSFFFMTSTFELMLWDNRKDSETYKNMTIVNAGDNDFKIVIVPPGVVHAYKNIGDKPGLVLNFPNKLYAGWDKKEKVDEIRYEDNQDSPFKVK